MIRYVIDFMSDRVIPKDDGQWVRWSEAEAEVWRLRAQLARERERAERLEEALRLAVKEAEQPAMLQLWPGVLAIARAALAPETEGVGNGQ